MKTSPLNLIVERIRSEQQHAHEVPGFDPQNGNETARFLFVLEASGPKAVTSGFISLDNTDKTAKHFRAQLADAGVRPTDIALWNVMPWYLGNAELSKIPGAKGVDVKQGLQYLTAVVAAIKNLQCIVLVGGTARQAQIHLSQYDRSHPQLLSPIIPEGTKHYCRSSRGERFCLSFHAGSFKMIANPTLKWDGAKTRHPLARLLG